MAYQYTQDQQDKTENAQRIAFFEYLFVLMLILYAGKGNTFFLSQSPTDNPIGFILPVILSGLLALRWRVIYDYKFYLLIFGFTAYFVAVSIKYKEIQPTFFIHYMLLFFIVYTAIKSLGFRIFKIYEYLLFWLAIIGLFMLFVQIVLGGDTLFNIISRINILKETSYVTGYGMNAILYSVQPSEKALLHNISLPRNCGFAWEPGAFAVYLCLALFINLFYPNRDAAVKKRFLVLLFALLSTQSTTGYVIFMLIISFYLINKKLQKVLIFLPVLVVTLIFISSLPFMKDKIIEYIAEADRINYIVELSIGRETAVNPQRFASFKIAFIDFMDNPVLGLAAHREETWTYKIGANVSPISGIGNLMAQFGIIGFLFFIILTVKSSFVFSRYYKYNGHFLLFFIIILVSVSYTLIFLPLIMCFWMVSLFAEPEANVINEKPLEIPDENRPGLARIRGVIKNISRPVSEL